MKIIILGAGQVGGTLAENLVGENNDITIVDKMATDCVSYKTNTTYEWSTVTQATQMFCTKPVRKTPICLSQ